MTITPDVFSTEDMLDDICTLVSIESPSRDIDQLNLHAQAVALVMHSHLGSIPELIESPVGPHIHWRGGDDPRVLILGHHDTVHPIGTLAEFPFAIDGNRATGPGIFDMKTGIVQAIHALGALRHSAPELLARVEILLTADEEIGSHASRALLEERAQAAGSVLVLEPSADGGALKTGRKGTGTFLLSVHGRASHAGLEPEKGINALIELATLLPQIVALADPSQGTTVTPTLASAGTADNVVPALATCAVDVRVQNMDEKARVENAMLALKCEHPDAQIVVSGGITRPPMHASASTSLMKIASEVCAEIGLVDMHGVEVGGGSDGNFTAACGVHTLDGLGAVGAGAHTLTEWIDVASLPVRAAIIAGLCQRLCSMDKMPPLSSVPAAR
jgi:glutamate carboxypeptidase